MRKSYEQLGLAQLADDSSKILVKTFPDSRYVTGDTGKAWWNFWSREEPQFGVQPTGTLADKPWWQFWN